MRVLQSVAILGTRATMAPIVISETKAEAVGGVQGRVATNDGILEIKLAPSRSLNGRGGAGAHPEHLFALGFAACYLRTLREAALRELGAFHAETRVASTVRIFTRADGGLGLAVVLEVDVPDMETRVRDRLLVQARDDCPYLRAYGTAVGVELILSHL